VQVPNGIGLAREVAEARAQGVDDAALRAITRSVTDRRATVGEALAQVRSLVVARPSAAPTASASTARAEPAEPGSPAISGSPVARADAAPTAPDRGGAQGASAQAAERVLAANATEYRAAVDAARAAGVPDTLVRSIGAWLMEPETRADRPAALGRGVVLLSALRAARQTREAAASPETEGSTEGDPDAVEFLESLGRAGEAGVPEPLLDALLEGVRSAKANRPAAMRQAMRDAAQLAQLLSGPAEAAGSPASPPSGLAATPRAAGPAPTAATSRGVEPMGTRSAVGPSAAAIDAPAPDPASEAGVSLGLPEAALQGLTQRVVGQFPANREAMEAEVARRRAVDDSPAARDALASDLQQALARGPESLLATDRTRLAASRANDAVPVATEGRGALADRGVATVAGVGRRASDPSVDRGQASAEQRGQRPVGDPSLRDDGGDPGAAVDGTDDRPTESQVEALAEQHPDAAGSIRAAVRAGATVPAIEEAIAAAAPQGARAIRDAIQGLTLASMRARRSGESRSGGATGGSSPAQQQQRPLFSRSGPSDDDLEFAAQVVRELGAIDALFRNPASPATTLEQALQDLAPDLRWGGEDTRTDERETSGADRRFVAFTAKGQPLYVYERDAGREVWIDVSRSERGTGGDRVYQAVADYARNTRRRFVGDPAGLSPDATVRRTYHMLSNMIRHGDSRAFEPAPEQLRGDANRGIAPLEWPSDNEGRLRALLNSFATTTFNAYPRLRDIRYDWVRREFVRTGVGAVPDADWRSAAADAAGDRTAPLGSRAMRAAVLVQSLTSSESGRRPGILAAVLRQPAALVERGGLRALFSRRGPSNKPAPPFFSAIERAVEGFKQPRAGAVQWLATLRNTPGVKQEELDMIGLGEWLSKQQSPLSREALLDFVRANAIEVKEIVRQANPKDAPAWKRIETAARRAGLELLLYDGEPGYLTRNDVIVTEQNATGVQARLLMEVKRLNQSRPRWGEAALTLPGGENYRELLLVVPTPEQTTRTRVEEAEAAVREQARDEGLDDPESLLAQGADGPSAQKSPLSPALTRRMEALRAARAARVRVAPTFEEWLAAKGLNYRTMEDFDLEPLRAQYISELDPRNDEYTQNHFDQPGLIAHVRFNERTDAQGRRVLFLEEIQSDLHARGRDEGYAEPIPKDLPLIAEQVGPESNPTWRITTGDGRFISAIDAKIPKEWALRIARNSVRGTLQAGRPPALPFKTTWPELALKRMVRFAAEEGFDRIAWTSGAAQVQRYGKRAHIGQVRWSVPGTITALADGRYELSLPDLEPRIYATRQEADAERREIDVEAFDPEGRALWDRSIERDTLAQSVGAAVAAHIERSIQSFDSGELRSLDLKIGGEGLEALYDRIFVAAANGIGRKFGTKVERGQLPELPARDGDDAPPDEAARSIHVLPIPPALRDAALAGQPLFTRSGDRADRAAEAKSRAEATPEAVPPLFQQRAARARAWLEQAAAKLEGAARIEIVGSVEALRERLGDPTIPDDVQGAWTGGRTAYLVADQLRDVAKAQRVFAHEVFGHLALEAFAPMEEAISAVQRLEGEGDLTIRQLMDKVDRTQEGLPAEDRAREVLALLAQEQSAHPVIARLIAAVRDFLRKLGVTIELSVADLRGMISVAARTLNAEAEAARARRELEGSERRPFGAPAAAQARDLAMPTARFSRRAAAPGEPLSAFHAENARLRGEDRDLWAAAKRMLRRQFAPGGLLPSEVFDQKIVRDSEVGAVEFDIRHLVVGYERAVKLDYSTSYADLDEATRRAHGEALAGRVPSDLPERTKVALVAMRQYVDTLSAEYLDDMGRRIEAKLTAGADPEEIEGLKRLAATITRNVGQYVHRSYRLFDDKSWPEKVSDAVLDNARRFLRDGYKAQGMDEAEAKRSAEVMIWEILKGGRAFGSIEAFIAESTNLGAADLSVLMARKDVPPELRELLGEYHDPGINFAKTAGKMGRLIWDQRFNEAVRDLGIGTFLFEGPDRPPEATAQLAPKGSAAHAPLGGLWTTPEIAQAFRDAMQGDPETSLYRAAVRWNGILKYGKTVLSPTTAMRNIQSSMFIWMANGHLGTAELKKGWAAFREEVQTRGSEGELAYLRRLKQLGVVWDTAYAGEMQRLLDDAQLEDLLEGHGRAVRVLRDVNRAARGFYTFGDDLWKISGFESEKAALQKAGFAREEAEVEAARRVRDCYPTYSMVGHGIRWLSRFPLAGTFVSFPAEIVRTTSNMIRLVQSDLRSDNPGLRAIGARRLVGMVSVTAAFAALGILSRAALGIDDDEDEAVRELAPPWSRNSVLLYTGRDADGALQYFDLSFLDPYGYLKRPLLALMRDEPWKEAAAESLKEALVPFLGVDIGAEAIYRAIANRKPSGGAIYNETAPAMEQTMAIANHLRQALQPGFVGNAERLVRAAQEQRREGTGQRFDLEDELLALGGWRASTLDPRVAVYYRAFDFREALQRARQTLSRELTSVNPVSDGDLLDALRSAETQRAEALRDMTRIVRAAEKSGMSRGEVVETLKLGGVAGRDVMAVVMGRQTPIALSDDTIQRAVRKAASWNSGLARQEVARRMRVVQRAQAEARAEIAQQPAARP
jgi:hypothetical protein